jgi:hypothetical protein
MGKQRKRMGFYAKFLLKPYQVLPRIVMISCGVLYGPIILPIKSPLNLLPSNWSMAKSPSFPLSLKSHPYELL